jgi:hypothetical protein
LENSCIHRESCDHAGNAAIHNTAGSDVANMAILDFVM